MNHSNANRVTRQIAFYLAFVAVAVASILMFSINISSYMIVVLVSSIAGVLLGRTLEHLDKRSQPKRKRKNDEHEQ